MSTPTRDIFFTPFRLDPERGRLWNGVSELAVRPKTVAVLHYLVEHADRIVTAADLVHAVWADSHGSAPLVKGCIRELRKLLGDDRATPAFIVTVGRRGYRFVAPVHEAADASESGTGGDDGMLFVGRDRETAFLKARLAAALAGRRQVVFIGGEVGIGKTALVRRFLATATAEHDLRIARGQCVEHYGPGEPYLPVLQALAATCRGPGGDRALDILRRSAPTWLAALPPFLSEAERMRLVPPAPGTDRARMVHELCEAVTALADTYPLVLWLDDLQWSDPSTVDLLSALARREEPARFLVLASQRPADVVVSDHPLGPVRRSLLASGHARELAMAALSGTDVARYLALRFPVRAIARGVGPAILEITDGNPLFLVTLVEELVMQRVLVDEHGHVQLRQDREALDAILPESLRHLIERQLDRLGAEDQRLLEAGSVAGREFSAGAVAAALDLDADAVDERLQELTRIVPLLEARGLDSPPHRPTSGRHAFVHALHQRVLYGRLAPARRARLHRRLGEAQAAAWGDARDDVASELALHFELGGDAARAVRFLRAAAENAAQRLAAAEATAHLTRALGLVDRLARRDRPIEELRLLMALGLMLMNSRSPAAPEIDRVHRRAADLAARLPARAGMYGTLRALHRITLVRGDLARAMAIARKAVATARTSGTPEERLEAYLALGLTHFYAGRPVPARAALARCLRLWAAVPASSPALRMLDPAIVIRAHLGLVACLLADDAAMLEHLAEMERHAGVTGQRFSVAYAHVGGAMLAQLTGDTDAVLTHTDALLGASDAPAFSLMTAFAQCARGWARATGGGRREGVDEVRSGMARWQEGGARFLVPYQLGLLGAAQAAVGRRAEGLATIEAALAIVRQTGERWYEPELLRIAGELRGALALRARGRRRAARLRAALAELRSAVSVARRSQARMLAARAGDSLARLGRLPSRAPRAPEPRVRR